MPAGSTENPVLRMEDLHIFFTMKKFLEKPVVVKAVDGVDLEVGKGEILAVVGESGSGKTTLGRGAIGLTRLTSGRVTLVERDGEVDVGAAKGKAWKDLRKKLQIVFQDPFSSIDPNMRVYDSLRIPLQSQGVKDRQTISSSIDDVLKRVGLPNELLSNYVFQLSGGQRQRIGIARVLLFNPALVVADEPVSMLDASLKGDILHIFEKEARDRGTAFIFITHDMAVARVAARRIAVLYLGKVAEIGPAARVIGNPYHPYTKALLEASPTIEPEMRETLKKVNVKGDLAISSEHPSGCVFNPRCPFVMDVCKEREPQLKELEPGHWASCWLY